MKDALVERLREQADLYHDWETDAQDDETVSLLREAADALDRARLMGQTTVANGERLPPLRLDERKIVTPDFIDHVLDTKNGASDCARIWAASTRTLLQQRDDAEKRIADALESRDFDDLIPF